MSFDNLTISAAIIAVIFSVIALRLATRNRVNEDRMRTMARQMMILQSNEKARELCKKIHAISGDLCAGLDFTFKENGDEVEIDEWYSKHPRPRDQA